ncbi:acyltransferase family protein [Bacteroides stercoris]|nr:acyltransferase family protein [Bacteroides stercoris]
MHSPTLATECRFGSLSVSIFFFLSGYGLICSYNLKGEKYLKGFLIHRIGKVIIPLLTAYAIYIPLLKIISNRGG